MEQPPHLRPGLMVVHGNRMERLRDLAVEWMRRYPLGPLENETLLVQSNGIAQWLRLALAREPDAPEPGLGLANGDVGITLPGDESGSLRVAFPAPEGGVRWISPARLEAVETVFAMTVHKAQGSEFRHAALVLPDRRVPVLTRELVYTAITRAARRFTLLEGAPGILAAAVGERVQRTSGLRERLANPPA